MRIRNLHDWPVKPAAMTGIQQRLATQAVHRGGPRRPTCVAGVDIAVSDGVGYGALVLLQFPELNVLREVTSTVELTVPYIPGFLSFREIPVLLPLFEQLPAAPDVVFVDGQGRLHPRELGLATHLGLWLDCPTVGCAKSRLCGTYREPGSRKGDRAPVRYHGRRLGYALRTRDNCRPILVSSGHRLGLKRAVDLTLAVTGKYRIPMPTRLAHCLAGRHRKAAETTGQ